MDHGLDIGSIIRTTSSQHGSHQNIWITLHLWKAFDQIEDVWEKCVLGKGESFIGGRDAAISRKLLCGEKHCFFQPGFSEKTLFF